MRLSQEPCLGVKVIEPPSGLLGEPSARLPGGMRGMIVEDQVDRGAGRVGRIEELEELDELTATVTNRPEAALSHNSFG